MNKATLSPLVPPARRKLRSRKIEKQKKAEGELVFRLRRKRNERSGQRLNGHQKRRLVAVRRRNDVSLKWRLK